MPLPAVAVVGNISFTLIGLPPTTVALADGRDAGADPEAGGWISALDFLTEIPVDYGAVTIVPLPAAFWALLGALAVLAGTRAVSPPRES